ncbi:MarR family winged helix-turn-helix transcriptional regulator [Aromatoleum diolicum]|uniref:MarR family transcriptional regulator n=1 Tax=Aromatoleum diolicum TaxID=75796 RepID=A0ABX1QDV0_9RHOO|nr:MarR family transcriptional regulator [Aromatoleum diolicum]NMG76554.1 MarR family transcriptional regulator [Aromatoleum diolicum]
MFTVRMLVTEVAGPTPMPPADTDWELRLGFLIHDVSRLRRSAFDRCLKPLNVTRSQWWVLAYLSRGEGMAQSQLAEELDLGKVAIGGLIDRLEKSGLVRRESDPNDRRVKRIFLSPKSNELIETMRKVNHQLNEQILSGLTDEYLTATVATLGTMKRNLMRYLEASGGADQATADTA